MNERWQSPYPRTIAYNLFIKHFTELNDVYWAHVPAASTIEKKALQELGSEDADPKQYFLVKDEDDRRISATYKDWKNKYREFSNYTRLSMLMLLSSCFETYLRTIVALAIESKPGVIIDCPDAVDGVSLLKSKNGYGDTNSKDYPFASAIDDICTGDWNKRASQLEKYFSSKIISEQDIKDLDCLRVNRNDIGHHFGRTKKKYNTPLFADFESANRLSHSKMISYFALVYKTVTTIDDYLKEKYIGAYDLVKFYFSCIKNGQITSDSVGQQAKDFQKRLGQLGFKPIGGEYCHNLISYCVVGIDNASCLYATKVSVKMIRRELKKQNIHLVREGRTVPFKESFFNKLVKGLMLRGKKEFCGRFVNEHQTEYFYSAKCIEFIFEHLANHIGDEIMGYKIKKGSVNELGGFANTDGKQHE